VPDRETPRLVAWSTELRAVHVRLREALDVTRAAVRAGRVDERASRDLLLFCHGFCAALDRHHRGEDRALFPALEAAHPHLVPVLRSLEQDHSSIARLLQELRAAVEHRAAPTELDQHLDGVAALLDNHFRYEERALLVLLDDLELSATPSDVLGPR
jgi:hemerythrin-like domain-containing protein